MTISEILGALTLMSSLALFWLGNKYRRDFLKTQHENDIKLNELVKNTELRNTFKIKNYEYFILKRNESYSELFSLAGTAYGYIASLSPIIKQTNTFEEYNNEDIIKLCEQSNFTKLKTKEISDLLGEGEREDAIKIYYEFLELINFFNCQEAHQKLINKCLLSKIYLSNDIYEDYKEIMQKCRSAIASYETRKYLDKVNATLDDKAKEENKYSIHKNELRELIDAVSLKTKKILDDSMDVANKNDNIQFDNTKL